MSDQGTGLSVDDDEVKYQPLPPALADSASWQLAAQLVRRHPDTLWVTTPIPFTGQYDLLDVRRLATPTEHPSLSLNRAGSALAVSWFGGGGHIGGPILQWQEALFMDDPRDWLVQVELAAGLTPPKGGLPPSTPSSLVVRWVSQFLWMHQASRERWTAWTEDRIEIPAGDDPFTSFPKAREWVRSRGGGSAQLLVQFVGPATRRAPRFALTADGDLWAADGTHHHLPSLHRGGGSVTALVAQTAGSVLP